MSDFNPASRDTFNKESSALDSGQLPEQDRQTLPVGYIYLSTLSRLRGVSGYLPSLANLPIPNILGGGSVSAADDRGPS